MREQADTRNTSLLDCDGARLRMTGMVKRFAGTLALDHVDFDVMPGEIHALLGQNGAGKSTLIRGLAGIYSFDDGEIEYEGTTIPELSPHTSHTLGMRFIHQELNLVPWFSVAENIVLGDRYPTRSFLINWKELNRRAEVVLERFGIDIKPSAPIQGLSVGQQWLVAIARALYTEGCLLVMDEPTASLSKREVSELLSFVSSLRQHGTSVIYISHRLQEIFEIAQRATVLRDGKRIVTCEVADLTPEKLAEFMVGRKASEIQHRIEPASESGLRLESSTRASEPAISVRDLSVDPIVHGVNFSVGASEIVGLTGLIGAGKTEIGSALFGLLKHTGVIRIGGKKAKLKSPRQAMRKGLALVPEERRRQSLVLDMSLRENLTLPYVSTYRRRLFPLLSRAAERKVTRGMVERLQVKTDGLETPIRNLSGGNQQKVVLGRWFQRPNIAVILDEPTRGIDVGARYEIFRFVRGLAVQGIGVLYISSDVEEVMQVADRILVLRDGAINADLPRSQTTAQEVLEYCYGQTKPTA